MAKKDGPRQIPLVEWIAALIGAGVVVVMIAVLAREGFRQQAHAPPLLTVQPRRLAIADGQYVLEVAVKNATRQTGSSVQVEGTLNASGEAVETSNASLSYVPGLSERHGGLIFTHDPRKYRVRLRVTGYERP
jgi:uncharacterized protein (TIGR02588 family)